MMNIINKRAYFFGLSGILLAISIVFIAIGGLKFGIDFTGGSLLEVSFENVPERQAITDTFQRTGIDTVEVQSGEENVRLLRFRDVNENEHQQILQALEEDHGAVVERRFEVIGPTIGSELRQTSGIALVIVTVAIILYIAYAFRKVSHPVKSWKYGLAAIIALLHDVVIVTGLFAVLGYFLNVEITILFVTALLTILGFSVNDTIVAFDRTRENLLKKSAGTSFADTVNLSINETVTRSLNTSITTFLVLFSLFLFGGESIRWFIVALMAGVVIGTYSSIFVASALLVEIEKRQKRA